MSKYFESEEDKDMLIQWRTAIDIAKDMKCNVPAFKENRLNLEKHILKSLAEKKDFKRYIKYINDPQTYTETFITEEVENLTHKEYKDKCNSFFRQKLSNIQQQILHAVHEASETTKKHNGNINMWLKEFTGSIKGELTFATIDPQNFTDVNNFDFLKEEIEKGLNSISADLSVNKLKWFRLRPDQILIDQLCDCCWETCPFCRAVCTNTMKDHKSAKDGGIDHSTPFHRSPSVKGWHYTDTVEMSLSFCTTKVAGDGTFYPDSSTRPDWLVPHKQYRTAGNPYDTWSITPDLYQMCYWQWVVCTFQKEFEENHGLKYEGRGKIPEDWRKVDLDQALKNLEKMYNR
uniref:Interferon-induced very large GTPase 1 n=1 Tax=Neogobius melanostomus TaxID=47308 RepID=A0A8C6WHC4_9GOBI